MTPRYAPFLVLALCLSTLAHGQHRYKIPVTLRAYIDHHAAPGEHVDVYVHGPREAAGAAVRAHGGTVKMDLPRLVSARVPADRIRALAEETAVDFFEFAIDPGFAMNDSMRVKNAIVPIHEGQVPLREGYDGEDVIVGIIDSGIDWEHADFRNADGSTRILKYWDQTLPVNSQTPQPYNYGQVWNSTQINAGQMTSVDQPQWNGHGSTVSGTMAGNGLANGRHKGIAYKSDMIIVSASFSGNFRARVADGVKYILDEAAALGRPVVINASLGSYLGSHDGFDASALFIDDLLQQAPGRVMVCAAGNSNTFPRYHVRTEVGADTAFTWYRYNANSGLGYGAVFFEVWADTADFNNVQYAIGADRATPWRFRGRTDFHTIQENLAGPIVEDLVSPSGNVLGTVEFLAFQRGGQYLLQVHMPQPDSTEYRFRFMTTGQGMHDVWSGTNFGTSLIQFTIPGPAFVPDIGNYVLPDRDQHIVDSWACSPHVITVANSVNEVSYVNHLGNIVTVPGTEGDIAAESSLGPARTGLMKPDVAATGSITLSAYPLASLAAMIAANDERVAEGGLHMRNGGTSMASPVVAGTAALYLQKCPQATHQEVRNAVMNTARSDDFTGATPNTQWGYGKLDAFAALLFSGTSIDVQAPAGFCEGEEMVLVAEGGMTDYAWSNGASASTITFDEEGPLSLVAINPSGCLLYSDTLLFELLEAPVPTVDAVGPLLTSSPAAEYQWYFNEQPIPGGDQQTLEAGTTGWYAVEVTYANGCTVQSAPVQVLFTGIPAATAAAFTVWPSPTRDAVTVALPDLGGLEATLHVVDAAGRLVREYRPGSADRLEIPVQGLAPGTYTVRLEADGLLLQRRFVRLP